MQALDPITRSDFQRLSDIRLQEASVLQAASQFAGAYYLAGYAVECALKACICKLTLPDHFPPRKEVVGDMYGHNLPRLLVLARLDKLLDAADAPLKVAWATAKDWNEQSRYNFPDEADAQQLYAAVADPTHGVLRWLRQHW